MKKTNFHTHTYRCGHGIGSEEEMVKAAIQQGFDTIGFSEHIPLPHLRSHLIKSMPLALKDKHAFLSCTKQILSDGVGMRMPYKTRRDHQKKVATCKMKYKNKITVYQGYEAEYLPEYLPYYQELIDSQEIDYLILGNHFNGHTIANYYYGKDDISKSEIIKYKDDLIKAMETNLFSYIAHPDLFLMGYPTFDEFIATITQEICEAALHYDLPLEINAGGVRKGLREDQQYPYCNGYFFDIASQVGNKIIIGIDAHSPYDFNDTDYQILLNFAKDHHLNLIDTFEFRKGK